MSEHDQGKPPPAEGYKVGYKKPPLEHRFKAGKKPKRRVRTTDDKSAADTLWGILHERRRTILNGKSCTISNLELVVRRLVEQAEKGNNSMQALLYDLIIANAPDEEGKMSLQINGQVFPFPNWD